MTKGGRDRRSHRHPEYRSAPRRPLVLLANDLDKPSNAGGILRTAEAFMVERVLFDRPEPETAGAMGAEHWQPVAWAVDPIAVLAHYKSRGYLAVGLEQCGSALPIQDFSFPERVILVVGSEMFGVSDGVLELMDALVYIPQAGLVKSLNVATAAGIAMYEYARQRWLTGFIQPARHLAPTCASVRVVREDS